MHPLERSVCLLGYCRSCRFDLRLDSIEVEARALLHWRKFNRSHREFLDLLLNEDETPELILEPIEVLLRSVLGPVVWPSCTLERIEAKVG